MLDKQTKRQTEGKKTKEKNRQKDIEHTSTVLRVEYRWEEIEGGQTDQYEIL